MPEIHLMNIKNMRKIENAEYVNCMRPNLLGNPFYMKSEKDRYVVLAKFKLYLRKHMQIDIMDDKISYELTRLAASVKTIVLLCCCLPKACHTEIIKDAIEYLRKEHNDRQ
jgi:hypothetical protein